MELEEAKRIAEAIGYADGGCSSCVEALCEKLNLALPAFVWELERGDAEIPEWDRNEDTDEYSARPLAVSVTPVNLITLPDLDGVKSV